MFRSMLVWLVICLVLMALFNQFSGTALKPAPSSDTIDYSQFIEEAKAGRINKVEIDGRVLRATTIDERKITSHAPTNDIWLVSDLLKYGVQVKAKPDDEPSLLMVIFVNWFPMLLLIGVWIFFMRQMHGGGRGGAFSFGKSRAKMMDDKQNVVTFADVAGCDEAKE